MYLFRDKGHLNPLYLPNLEPNRNEYHVSHEETSRDKLNLHFYQTYNYIGLNLIFAQGSFQYFHFTEYKSK